MDRHDFRHVAVDRLIDTIVGLARATDPRISPDARWVAYVNAPYFHEGEHARAAIWLAPADGSAPARPFTSGDRCDDTPRWSPDGRTLAFLSDRLTPGVKSLYRIAVDGGEGQLLVERERRGIERVAWSPDGARIAFTAVPDPDPQQDARDGAAQVYGEDWRCARLYVLDLASNAVSMLPTGDVHVRQLAWSPDGSRLAYLAWPTPEEEEASLRAAVGVIPADGGASLWLHAMPSAQSAWLTWPVAHRMLCVAPRTGGPQSSFTVFAVDESGGAVAALAPATGEPCCAAGCQGAERDPRAAVAIAQDMTTRLEWLHPLTGARAALYAFPSGEVHEFSVAVDSAGPVLAVTQSTGDTPRELYVGRPGRLACVTSHHASLNIRIGRQEPFCYSAADGLALDGQFIRPAGTSAPPWPTLVLPHGGPYGRSGNGFNLLWGQLLAAQGYAVLLPNYRGGFGRGEAFANMVRGDVGGAEFRDVIAAVDAAVARGLADDRRLGIGGWSQGGYLAAWAVTQTTRFKAAVVGAGISHWGMEVMTSDLPTFEGVLAGGHPWDGPGSPAGELRSPISYAGNVATPVLILHGQDDRRVPVSQGIAFERALRGRGVAVQLVTYPRAPHQIRGRHHQRDILRRVVGWFDRWLLGASPKTGPLLGSEPSSASAPSGDERR